MKDRDSFLKRLHENEKYKAALAMARTDAEKQAIRTLAESFVSSFADVLGPLIDKSQHDPLFAERLGQALVERKNVVTSTEPEHSGSIDHG